MIRQVIIAVLALASSALADGFATLADEVRIPLAPGWQVAVDSGNYPFQLVNEEQSAELLVFKSIIDKNEIIQDEKQLKGSVDRAIDDVILTLPEARLVASTGYFNENRAGFALDFVSFDEDREIEVLHRLVGVLYQHPDGYQLLFSLWGKTARAEGGTAIDEIRLMQDEFAYRGDAETSVFGGKVWYDWYLIGFLFMLLIAMLFILRRRQQKPFAMFADEANFWRCSCGRLNHNDNSKCRRCGKPQTAEPVS